jgi:hypothetical protein
VRANAEDVDGIDVRWPTNVAVARILIRKLLANVERDRNATFPLLGMLQRARTAAHVGDAPPTPPPAQPTPASPAPAAPPLGPPQAPAAAGPKLAIDIGEIILEDGLVRFADHSITPPQTEELSRLAASVKGLSNAEGKRARLDAQGVVGASGAIEWHGEIAPLAEKLYVDMDVELRNFAIPRTNPRLQNLLAWIARDGQLSTKLKIKLDGDKLDANSDIVVGRLDMVPGGEGDEVKQRIGLPLGMIIGLMKDARGEIRLSVPVSGSLNAPEFSLKEAIWGAVKSIIANVVLAPFRAIGRLFSKDDKIESVSIDPVRFGSGTAALAPGAEEHLKKVAEVLQKAPAIRIGLAPVVTEGDLLALKTQEVTARLQRIQREQGLPNLEAAGGRLYAERFPGKQPPKTLEEIVAALRDAEPAPQEAGRALAGRRLEATREALVKTGQIDAGRLQTADPPAGPAATGEGRVEFSILP